MASYLLGVIDRERLIFISCLIRLTVVAMTTGMLVVYPNSHSRRQRFSDKNTRRMRFSARVENNKETNQRPRSLLLLVDSITQSRH